MSSGKKYFGSYFVRHSFLFTEIGRNQFKSVQRSAFPHDVGNVVIDRLSDHQKINDPNGG
jgi:hypothetical protein